MIYRLLHWIGGIMLHWFYSEIRVEHQERIPASGPTLVAVNHPNAMVDSLVAGWVMPRRLRFTAKATLLRNPLVALMFRVLGVVPLRRAADLKPGEVPDRHRNRDSFEEIVRALRTGGSVLIFPEGRSNSDELMPLKTGLARIALEARRSGVAGLTILPIGLAFEDKAVPGSRVLARVGEPVVMDQWAGDSPRDLTDEIAARLAGVSSEARFEKQQPRAKPESSGILVRMASWWGRTTHEIPVRYARTLAVERSSSADEPAMLTMLFGMGLVIASYAIHLAIVGVLTRSLLISSLYLATLIAGAYWTAFEGHRR